MEVSRTSSFPERERTGWVEVEWKGSGEVSVSQNKRNRLMQSVSFDTPTFNRARLSFLLHVSVGDAAYSPLIYLRFFPRSPSAISFCLPQCLSCSASSPATPTPFISLLSMYFRISSSTLHLSFCGVGGCVGTSVGVTVAENQRSLELHLPAFASGVLRVWERERD